MARLISSPHNAVEELSLAMNPRISDRGLYYLADALRALRNSSTPHHHTTVKLKSLWLWGNPLVTTRGAEAIAAALADDSSHIRDQGQISHRNVRSNFSRESKQVLL